jgi:hypothetical protein
MPETIESQELERATGKVLQRIRSEPAHRSVLYKILDFCGTERSTAAINKEVNSYPEMQPAFQSPQVLLSWLIQAGGIEPIEDEKGAQVFITTKAGRNVVRLESPNGRIEHLLAEDLVYHDIYLQVLHACLTSKSKGEIESMLCGNPVLENPMVYPSFIIGRLEEAGGLEWDGKWRTTQPGKDYLDERVVRK